MLRLPLALVLVSAVLPGGAPVRQHDHAAGNTDRLGTVHFATSCTPDAQPVFDRAVALLHSFEFGAAIDGFDDVLRADPSCAMAEWGIALSRWSNPFAVGERSAEQVGLGRAAVERARTLGATTERERAYIDAVGVLYGDAPSQFVRLAAYRDAMRTVVSRFPEDAEAKIFLALSLTAAEDPSDKSYASRLQAAAILEPLFKAQPDHPGLAHYLIHTYDVPALAPRALDAARRYAEIAPSAPHALHMPSHTFTRLGLWQESIDTNIAAAAAAREQHATAEELHASDYQMYAYLQTAQDAKARALLESLPAIVARFDPHSTAAAAPPAAGFFAAAAIPARWVLERGEWAAAARLPLAPSPLPFVEALTEFARALGAARSGDLAAARAAVDRLAALRDREAALNEPYWAGQIDIQQQSAAAWLAFAGGRRADAVQAMRAAAAAEDRTEKSAMTPGPLAPAHELLGEMLLAAGDPRGALEAFDATLAREPHRFRALVGAARSAAQLGNQVASRGYFEQLLTSCAGADQPGRPELEEARAAARGR